MSKKNCESEARKKIAASIGATPEEIYFTSGRADGHLKALKAVVKASKKARPHVIITTMEDPEVLDECSRLERKDAVVTYLDPITTGRVEVAMIENELKENAVYQEMLEKISKYEEQVQTMGLSKEKRKTIDAYVTEVSERWILYAESLYQAGMQKILELLNL